MARIIQFSFAALVVSALAAAPSQAALLFYESFTGYTAGGASLDGQGGWGSVGGAAMGVYNGTSNFSSTVAGSDWNGTLAGSATSGGNFIGATVATATFGDIALASFVTDSFTDGSTTWLSFVSYNSQAQRSRVNLAIGAAAMTGAGVQGASSATTTSGGQEMAGQGIGVGSLNGDAVNQASVAAYWNPNPSGNDKVTDSTNIGAGRPYLNVAKIVWGTGGGVDTISVARFTDITGLTEASFNSATKSTISFALDQSTFDTLSFANLSVPIDDIRIANDFASAITGTVVIPEPASLVLLCLGGLMMIKRRKA